MNKAATPNHALQRTAPRVTVAAILAWTRLVRSWLCPTFVASFCAPPSQLPRHAPPSLSLGSLGRMKICAIIFLLLGLTMLARGYRAVQRHEPVRQQRYPLSMPGEQAMFGGVLFLGAGVMLSWRALRRTK